ncbi:cytochrome b/b6 domain-containing protein [Shewanella gaetbuli]
MQPNNNRIKVWDLPVRIFHWGMVSLLALLWWTADAGEMELHQVMAYLLCSLLVFRVVWGVVGSETAKFSQFLRSPKAALQYAKSNPKPESIGHNPLGAFMVVLLMLLLMVQFSTGLFATDDIFTEGPLNRYISSDLASTLTWIHKQAFNVILAFAAIHVLAIIIYLIKGDNLIAAMITGYKKVNAQVAQPKLRSIWIALVIFAGIFSVVWFVELGNVVAYL